MNKRGEELTTNQLIGAILTLLFVIVVSIILGKVFLNKGCPAGYDLVEKSEFNPSIEKICGNVDNSGEILCCSRKSNPLQVCEYYREDKRFECEKLTSFNPLKVCGDNTACGVSTGYCSGGYCEKGICLVKDGVGKCVERFEIDGKEIIVNQNSCTKEFDGISVGSRCDGTRHCIFDSFTRDGKCLGLDLSIGSEGTDLENVRDDCRRFCADARDSADPLSSRYCTARFPIYDEEESKIVNTLCYNAPINVRCGNINCKPTASIPQN